MFLLFIGLFITSFVLVVFQYLKVLDEPIISDEILQLPPPLEVVCPFTFTGKVKVVFLPFELVTVYLTT
jgi:hypothetical protein